MSNPYLDALRAKYDGLRDGIKGLQQKALDENRDLTDDELTLVRSQSEDAKTIYSQIEELTEIEQRNAKVADLAASLLTTSSKDGDDETRGKALGITAQERDPGHYRSEKDGGRHSFFADLYHARMGDEDASRRIVEHQRAEHQRAGLTTTGNGPGVVQPHWLTNEFETLARQGRALANAVRSIPLGDDPRPLTLPKQTAGTDSVVAEQAAENDPVDGTDAWDSDVDVVSPKPTAGKQIVSRQLLDMSSPAIDQLIYGDLLSVYNTKVEAKVSAAVLAAGPTALAASETGVSPVTITDDSHFANVTIDAAIAVRESRKLGADIVAMSVGRWGKFKKIRDLDGRPLIPSNSGQAVNVNGVGSVNVDGVYEDLGIVATDGFPTVATFAVLRASDTLLFESNLLRFRYEEQAGPESIVLGIWGYTAVLVRQGGKGVQRVTVTPTAS